MFLKSGSKSSMKHGNNNQFDILLERAKGDEGDLAKILSKTGDKIELKVEYKFWKKTGNIAIEIQGYGKPSGIMVTKAQHWIHALRDEANNSIFYMIIETERLKRIIKPYVDAGLTKNVGDRKQSVCVMLPIEELIREVRGVKSKETKKQAQESPKT